MQEKDALAVELEKTHDEILRLAERVKRLVVKRSEREVFLQGLHRTTGMPGRLCPAQPSPHYLCSLCATEFAELAIEHVRGCSPGHKCDQCGQPAIIWIQLKTTPTEATQPELVSR